MRHVSPVSRLRRPAPAQQGVTTPIETLIILIFSTYFLDWDNGQTVIQNLAKYFGKTP
jgi:hypothetical protein